MQLKQLLKQLHRKIKLKNITMNRRILVILFSIVIVGVTLDTSDLFAQRVRNSGSRNTTRNTTKNTTRNTGKTSISGKDINSGSKTNRDF